MKRKRDEYMHTCRLLRLTMKTLRQIADCKRNTLERRLAKSTLTFIECLEETL